MGDLACTAAAHRCEDGMISQLCALCQACRDWNLGTFSPWDLTLADDDYTEDSAYANVPGPVCPKVPEVTICQVSSSVQNGKTTPPPSVGTFTPSTTPRSVWAITSPASSSFNYIDSLAPAESDVSSSYLDV